MGNFKCEVTLEQYTPMIHFQWFEQRACLRASEVRPKLDKYILSWLARQNISPQDLPTNWSDVNDGQTSTAFRYKMRFSAEETKELGKTTHPLFFGNQGLKPWEKGTDKEKKASIERSDCYDDGMFS